MPHVNQSHTSRNDHAREPNKLWQNDGHPTMTMRQHSKAKLCKHHRPNGNRNAPETTPLQGSGTGKAREGRTTHESCTTEPASKKCRSHLCWHPKSATRG